ncbi:MAG TPA: hypothetical protein VHA77_16915 [Xanthobacteraceae bacterium]|nr:hypothetical protein [Xanthobacteraceae bacterium]
MTDFAGFLLLSAIVVWAAWVLAWALVRLFGTPQGWLLIALTLGGVGFALLYSDGEYATLAAFACIAAAAILVCLVEFIENARERDRRLRQRAFFAQEQRRRDRERMEAWAQAQSASQTQAQSDAASGSEPPHPLNAEFIDGIWVVPEPGRRSDAGTGKAGNSETEKADDKTAADGARPADLPLGLRAIAAPCPASDPN